MELYHIHLKGNYDRLYKENNVINIDDKFNNRIYKRIYNMNSTVSIKDYPTIVAVINYMCEMIGIGEFKDRINLGEIIEYILKEGCNQEILRKILTDAKEMILAEGINLREMAMEEYRKNNCIDKPSRMHSLFASTEEGINFWLTQIRDNDVEIFRIDTINEPFVSNESLLPYEKLSYGDKIEASYRYFNPREKDLNTYTNEYLIQGKVKILKKVQEIKVK